MKKRALGIIAVLGLGLVLGSTIKLKNFGQANIVTTIPENKTAAEKQSGDTAVIWRVIDGDTVELRTGEHLRYIGMDSPETVDPKKPVQCFGSEASARNKELVEGKTVRLEKDVEDKDRYGRLLRYVWIGNTMIDKELVEEGYARAYPYPPDTKHAAEFAAAEASAKATNLGLWRACK